MESPSLKFALFRWEQGRILYNIVLLGFGLFWSWPLREKMVDEALLGYWGSVLGYGLTANVFYTLGPAAEAYCHAWRNHGFGKWRAPLFALGLAASIGMTWTFVWTVKILYVVLYHGH